MATIPKRFLLPALLGVLAAWVAATPAGAVVGGTPVAPETVPWFASLGGCGGTLVQPDRILTAAHCVAGRSPARDLGGVQVGGVTRTATRIALHPNWPRRNGSANFLDDVAIVQLDAPVTGVPLVTLGGVDAAEAHILGRGRPFAPGTGHGEAGMLDGTLRTAVLKTLSDSACARAFKGYRGSTGERFDRRMRCSIDADGRPPLSSGCNGDSGGPLWAGTPGAPVQLGVVSWGGDRCGADHLPSVFADVARYRGFITDPSPTWAPAKVGAHVHIAGTPRAGRTLRCSTHGYVPEAGATVGYSWIVVGGGASFGSPKPVGRGRTYTAARSDRGHHVACIADASNEGGYVDIGTASTLVGR